jgi:predicted porin
MSTYVDDRISLLDKNDSFYANSGIGIGIGIGIDDAVSPGLVYQF